MPLNLPKGSVRAVLALALTGAAIAATWINGVAAEYVWPAALTVNAFYFASRTPAE